MGFVLEVVLIFLFYFFPSNSMLQFSLCVLNSPYICENKPFSRVRACVDDPTFGCMFSTKTRRPIEMCNECSEIENTACKIESMTSWFGNYMKKIACLPGSPVVYWHYLQQPQRAGKPKLLAHNYKTKQPTRKHKTGLAGPLCSSPPHRYVTIQHLRSWSHDARANARAAVRAKQEGWCGSLGPICIRLA